MAGNPIFDLQGVSHLALVSSDMARTVDFYTNVLGMPLVKTMDLPSVEGQHFFFDIGNGDTLAFFYFEASPRGAVGLSYPEHIAAASASGSMHHVAFRVAPENFADYVERLAEQGIETELFVHDIDNKVHFDLSAVNDKTYALSVYFRDPDGFLLEFAAWMPAWDLMGAQHEPRSRVSDRAPEEAGAARA